MKNTTMLTLVAITILALSGCSCGWPRWLSRGGLCNGCSNSYGEGTYTTPALIAPSYATPQELPPALPGPIPTPSP